jgi:Holliday junction DNA helicase RuvA
MFYYLKGKLDQCQANFCVVDIGGVGYKIFTSEDSRQKAQRSKEEVKFFTYFCIRQETIEIYGFTSIFELEVFKKLINIAGIGPKSAVAVLNVAGAEQLVAAINEGRPELLIKVAGIGKKTAERVVLELKGKIESPRSTETVKQMEANADIEEVLRSLGYKREQAREAVEKINPETQEFEARLKEALKNAGGINKKNNEGD